MFKKGFITGCYLSCSAPHTYLISYLFIHVQVVKFTILPTDAMLRCHHFVVLLYITDVIAHIYVNTKQPFG